MAKLGPFFYINGRLIFHACSFEEARKQADKLDNSYGHERLYDDHFRGGDYIYFPRGRVIWDCTNHCAILYTDRCIANGEVKEKVIRAFELEGEDVRVEFDDHYRCRRCTGAAELWL